MRILVACEESQEVTIELRKLGHEVYRKFGEVEADGQAVPDC